MKIFPHETLAAAGEIVPARFTVERKPLADALALLTKVITRRNTIPILDNVLIEFDGFDTLSLVGTDLDNQLTITLPASGPFAFGTTANAKALQDVVKKLEAAFGVECTMQDDRLELRAGRSVASVKTLPRDAFPIIRDPDGDSFAIATLGDDLATVAPSMSTEETRYYLNGVALQARDDRLMLVATDGNTLAAVGRPLPEGAESIPDSIIQRKTVDLLQRAIKGLKPNYVTAELQGAAKIAFTFNFPAGKVRLVAKLVDGTFPDWQRLAARDDDSPEPVTIANPEFEPRLNPAYVKRMQEAVGAPLTFVHDREIGVTVTCDDRPEFYGMIAFRTVTSEDASEGAAGTVTYTDEAGNVATMPLGSKAKYENGPISLSAADVAKLCGPVDPSTFVPIPVLIFQHGRIIARDGIATDGSGRSVYRPSIKRVAKAAQRTRDNALSRDADAMAAHVKAHSPVYFDEPDAVAIEAPAPLMITYQPQASVTPASACEPETAVTEPEPAVAPCAAVPAPDTVAIEPDASPPIAGTVLDRLAALEAALGLETGTVENPDVAQPVAESFSHERRMRFIRRYLDLRARRELDRTALLAAGDVLRARQEQLTVAESRVEMYIGRTSQAESKLETMHRDLVVHTRELVDRATAAEAKLKTEGAAFIAMRQSYHDALARQSEAEAKAAELQVRLNAIASAMTAAAPAIDDAIAGKVRAVEEAIEAETAEPVEAVEAEPKRGFVVTRKAA